MVLISSRENEAVKFAASLQQAKMRHETGLCLLEGLRLVEEAINAAWQVKELFIEESAAQSERMASLIARADEQSVKTYYATAAVVKKIATTDSPQGVIAVAEQPRDVLPVRATGECWLLADELQDPGNFGTILRSADASGCNGVLLTGNGVDPFGPKAVRASMGSLFHLPVVVNNDRQAVLTWIREQKLSVFIADAGGTLSYSEADYKKGCVIVIGNEARGVSPFWRAAADAVVGIPIFGKAESLNAAVAASLLLYEAARQRHLSC